MNILLLSTLVSLITLSILLFNKRLPEKLKIPSSFLGSSNEPASFKIRLTRPPWLAFILVCLATMGAALAYLPAKQSLNTAESGQKALLWVDRSFSSLLAAKQNEVETQSIALEIARLGLSTSGISEDGQLVSLNTVSDIENHIKEVLKSKPSAFEFFPSEESFRNLMFKETSFSQSKPNLLVVSDGQQSTLRHLVTLKDYFSSAKLFPLKPSSFEILKSEELVPTELLKLWKETSSASTPWTTFPSSSQVPETARPGVWRQFFNEENVVVPHQQKNQFSAVVVCSLQAPGPSELDSFADLRTLIKFFAGEMRAENCDEENFSEGGNPWDFRKSVLYVVPVEEEVFNTLNSKAQLWFPRNFSTEKDVLVYVGSTKLYIEHNPLQKFPIQLASDESPLALYLAPPPPLAPLQSPSGIEKAFNFEPILVAGDKTVLGYKTADAPVYYLRTTAGTQNGELGRSTTWIQFWLSLAGTHPSITQLSFISPPESFEYNQFLSETNEFISPLELLTPGLYSHSESKKNIILVYPKEELSQSTFYPSEFSQNFGLADSTSVSDETTAVTPKRALLGAALTFLGLSLLWFYVPRLAIAVFIFIAFTFSDSSFAQSPFENLRQLLQNRNGRAQVAGTKNIPVRIGWCDAQVPENVSVRYKILRNVLSSRGTIELPEALIPGACSLGKSEVWWTYSQDSLSYPQALEHITGGGVIVFEGSSTDVSKELLPLQDSAIGLTWEQAPKRGMLYRSFYLLQTFDGCTNDSTKVLSLRKKANANSPVALLTKARFLSDGSDCFLGDEDYRQRSFVNLMYSLFVTDYKEDQLHLPEILSKVRNLGLEP